MIFCETRFACARVCLRGSRRVTVHRTSTSHNRFATNLSKTLSSQTPISGHPTAANRPTPSVARSLSVTRDCTCETRRLRGIAGECLRETGGLLVGPTDDDPATSKPTGLCVNRLPSIRALLAVRRLVSGFAGSRLTPFGHWSARKSRRRENADARAAITSTPREDAVTETAG